MDNVVKNLFEMRRGRYLQGSVRQGPIHPRTAASWLLQAATAIRYAHEQKVLHRDLKPGNLLLAGPSLVPAADTTAPADAAWEITVADFGLARLLDVTCRQTGTGEVICTPSSGKARMMGRDGMNASGAACYRLMRRGSLGT
jgi:serine/threonine protein kinase